MSFATIPAAPASPKDLVHKAEAKKGVTAGSFDPATYVMEPKYDGQRVLAHIAEDGVHIYSHTGTDHTGKLPKIEAEFGQLPAGTWIDCEAVAFTIDGDFVVHEWGSVQSCLGANVPKARTVEDTITFVAFDLIAHADIDARSVHFGKRRMLLETIFDKYQFERVILTPQMAPTDDGLSRLLAQGFEGGVVKSLGSRYVSGGRGAGQYKLKPAETDDFVVMGFQDGKSGWTGLVGAIIFGAHDADGKLVELGTCSGFDMATRLALTKNPDAYLGKVFECGHWGVMKDGYRHPNWKRWRPDKLPAECRV